MLRSAPSPTPTSSLEPPLAQAALAVRLLVSVTFPTRKPSPPMIRLTPSDPAGAQHAQRSARGTQMHPPRRGGGGGLLHLHRLASVVGTSIAAVQILPSSAARAVRVGLRQSPSNRSAQRSAGRSQRSAGDPAQRSAGAFAMLG